MSENNKKECAATRTFDLFISEFESESDRGCVLLAAAMIDNILEVLIKHVLIECKTKNDSLFDDATAPLGTLSAKIDLAYRLGIISDNLRRDLHIIRKIRNDFAHDVLDCTFANAVVKERIHALRETSGEIDKIVALSGIKKEAPERLQFMIIASSIIFFLCTPPFIKKLTKIGEAQLESMYHTGNSQNVDKND